jgi:hypothetical protein
VCVDADDVSRERHVVRRDLDDVLLAAYGVSRFAHDV